MAPYIQEFSANPMKFIGILIFVFGMLLFLFGKKFFLFRLILGDRSMFYQILYGTLIAGVGLVLLFISWQ